MNLILIIILLALNYVNGKGYHPHFNSHSHPPSHPHTYSGRGTGARSYNGNNHANHLHHTHTYHSYSHHPRAATKPCNGNCISGWYVLFVIISILLLALIGYFLYRYIVRKCNEYKNIDSSSSSSSSDNECEDEKVKTLKGFV